MNLSNKSTLIFGFLTLGILFLFLAFFIGKPENRSTESQLAKVHRLTGQVDLITSQLSKRIKVEKSHVVKNKESIQTDDIGAAQLILETGQELQILPSTMITLEKIETQNSLQILVVIKSGDIQIKSLGRSHSLFIAKNGERIESEKYQDSTLSLSPTIESSESKIEHSIQGLTEKEISTTLAQFRPQFFKCFIRLLQKNPKTVGEASLIFTIQNNGHASHIDVTTELGDEEFKKCLLQVMDRIEFKAFQGPAISTVFPLKFEP